MKNIVGTRGPRAEIGTFLGQRFATETQLSLVVKSDKASTEV